MPEDEEVEEFEPTDVNVAGPSEEWRIVKLEREVETLRSANEILRAIARYLAESEEPSGSGDRGWRFPHDGDRGT